MLPNARMQAIKQADGLAQKSGTKKQRAKWLEKASLLYQQAELGAAARVALLEAAQLRGECGDTDLAEIDMEFALEIDTFYE